MEWTEAMPTVEGFYWLKFDFSEDFDIVKVIEDGGGRLQVYRFYHDDYEAVEDVAICGSWPKWLGPLETPPIKEDVP